ncbi:UNVERIFIED_CONTAM: hypothetical protein Slati_2234800 [Sesamum latifolium]|uniref:Reverse transcriptase RNase H-like domain-containing protein n=1 Tax=Sesamum latifolium TaxID=2727402 RepID=A0AAW2WYT0_9LAMI
MLIPRLGELLPAFCEGLLRDNAVHDGLAEEDIDLEFDTPMPSSLRQLEESDGDRSCVGLTKYVEPFAVETDASDFTLGGLLMQDSHPVAFESMKLKDVERRYSIHEKEFLAVVHCFRLWRHYLLGSPFVVKTNNTIAGSSNHVVDALSRMADLTSLGSVAALVCSTVATSVRDRRADYYQKIQQRKALSTSSSRAKLDNFGLKTDC